MLFFNNADFEELKTRYPLISTISELYARGIINNICSPAYDSLQTNDSLLITGAGSANGMNWITVQTPSLGNMFLHAGKETDTVTAVRPVMTEDASLLIYPNPAASIINIKLKATVRNATIQLSDMAGRVLLEQAVRKGVNTVNISNLMPGVYMVKYLGDGQKQLYRFTKTAN